MGEKEKDRDCNTVLGNVSNFSLGRCLGGREGVLVLALKTLETCFYAAPIQWLGPLLSDVWRSVSLGPTSHRLMKIKSII